jgi:hypothetical protein
MVFGLEAVRDRASAAEYFMNVRTKLSELSDLIKYKDRAVSLIDDLEKNYFSFKDSTVAAKYLESIDVLCSVFYLEESNGACKGKLLAANNIIENLEKYISNGEFKDLCELCTLVCKYTIVEEVKDDMKNVFNLGVAKEELSEVEEKKFAERKKKFKEVVKEVIT